MLVNIKNSQNKTRSIKFLFISGGLISSTSFMCLFDFPSWQTLPQVQETFIFLFITAYIHSWFVIYATYDNSPFILKYYTEFVLILCWRLHWHRL